MEIRKNNLNGSDRTAGNMDERIEEGTDQSLRDRLQTSNRNTDTDAAALYPVGNPGDEEGDEDYDDEEDAALVDDEEVDLDDDELDEADFDDDLDEDLDDDDEDDDDDTL